MPLYDFQCKACNHAFEKQLKIAEMDNPLAEPCPECKKEGEMQRLIGGTVGFMDPVALGLKKPSEAWTDWLKVLKKNTPNSTDFNTFR